MEIAGVGTESVPASEARRFSHGLKLRVNLRLAWLRMASRLTGARSAASRPD